MATYLRVTQAMVQTAALDIDSIRRRHELRRAAGVSPRKDLALLREMEGDRTG